MKSLLVVLALGCSMSSYAAQDSFTCEEVQKVLSTMFEAQLPGLSNNNVDYKKQTQGSLQTIQQLQQIFQAKCMDQQQFRWN